MYPLSQNFFSIPRNKLAAWYIPVTLIILKFYQATRHIDFTQYGVYLSVQFMNYISAIKIPRFKNEKREKIMIQPNLMAIIQWKIKESMKRQALVKLITCIQSCINILQGAIIIYVHKRKKLKKLNFERCNYIAIKKMIWNKKKNSTNLHTTWENKLQDAWQCKESREYQNRSV